MDYVTFSLHIKDLCLMYEGTEISGIRSPRRNATKGGHLHSLHLVGLARDVAFDTERSRSLALKRAKQLGLHYELKGDTTVHFQALPPLSKEGDFNGRT